MRVLGPLDRRNLRTRCVACSRRKIKCEGGPPCVYCSKKKQACIPQSLENTAARFVVVFPPSGISGSFSVIPSPPTPRRNICSLEHRFIRHFFSTFLSRNEFGDELDFRTIASSFQQSPSLYNAVLALGASDASKGFGADSSGNPKATMSFALKAYRTSIVIFQQDVINKSVLQTESSLWTTFFLGLFELMHDDSGEGWIKHILYGTSKILQLRGAEAHLTGSGRSFFLTIRVFEICRSLIYSEPTFLSENSWMNLMLRIRNEAKCIEWLAKEELFDVMIACTSLSQRVWNILKDDPTYITPPVNNALLKLVTQGHDIRSVLGKWYTKIQEWGEKHHPSTDNNHLSLAIIYFHATSIYLSGIYDYRVQFLDMNIPTLPQNTIQMHVDAILVLTAAALMSTNLAGLLFFFPLRVAGARVRTVRETEAISRMLEEITRRGFVVADAFTSDLHHLWTSRGIS